MYYSSFNHKSITLWGRKKKQHLFSWKQHVEQMDLSQQTGHMAVES